MRSWANIKPPMGYVPDLNHWAMKNCIGMWLFNENGGGTAYDLSGNNNAGSLTNTSFPPSAISGWAGSGLNVDGVNDFIDISQVPLTGAFTVEARARQNDPANIHTIFGWDTGGFYPALKPFWLANRAIIYFGANNLKIFNRPLNDLGFHQYIFCIKGAAQADISNADFYIDGKLANVVAVDATGLPVARNNPKIAFGAAGGSWAGEIDFVRIWDYAIPAEMVQELYVNPFCMFPLSKYYYITGSAKTFLENANQKFDPTRRMELPELKRISYDYKTFSNESNDAYSEWFTFPFESYFIHFQCDMDTVLQFIYRDGGVSAEIAGKYLYRTLNVVGFRIKNYFSGFNAKYQLVAFR